MPYAAGPTTRAAATVAVYTGGMSRLLISVGLVLVLAGVVLHFAPAIPLGRLPGDIRIERPGTRIYIPIVTSIVLSIVLSLVLWLIGRFR